MKVLKTLVVSSIFAFGIAGAASAVTYQNVQGVAWEGGPSLGSAPAVSAGQDFGDFGTRVGSPILEVTHDLELYGAVRVRSGHPTSYRDGWTFDFGTGIYDGIFNWADSGAGRRSFFDGQLLVNGVQYLLGNSGSYTLSGLTGEVTFLVDPIFNHLRRIQTGTSSQRRARDEVATWNVQLTQIEAPAPVPLPAGAVLLLGALGGLAVMRRRTKAA